jgi:glycine/D-amino acid oxidase-like deaminating enzyme/nitrite reductase/ring-hydroxylating ferredoxin subunit
MSTPQAIPVPAAGPDLPAPRSLWLATAPPIPARPGLDGDVEGVDVAIVGGGVAGLTTALACAGAGLSVIVLEADRVGEATSGHSTVKVTAGHGTAYRTILEKQGEDAVRAYGAANVWGMDEVARIVAEHGIECELARVAHCVYADTDDQVEIVDQEFDAERRAGLAVERVDELDLPFSVTAAIRNEGQIVLHPVKYLRGLADAAERAGARIVEGTRVTTVDGDTVITERGEVRAEHVVIATHAPILDDGALFSRYLPHMEYAIAVSTRDAVPAESYIYCTDPTRSMRWVDVDGERLLILVGEGHKVGEDQPGDQPYVKLVDWVDSRWGVERVVNRWCTHDLYAYDGLPIMGRMEGATNRYVLTAFGTWGFTNATAGAAIVLDAIGGREHEWARTFAPGEHHVKGGVTQTLKENVKAVGTHLVGDRLKRHGGEPDQLEAGDGDVFRVHGREVAVSRDDDGSLTAVSATCTHMGCVVAWNSSERTWDCPCHGSRFAVDGTVLEGPAVHGLERKPV